MNFRAIAGPDAEANVDQDGQDYVRDQGQYAIECNGHYTLEELLQKVEQLKDANRFWKR